MFKNSSRAARAMLGAILVLSSWSCGDDPAGPEDIDFPTLSAQVQTLICFRDNVTKNQTKSGAIASSDCDDSEGYYETYIVKVASTGVVTFTVDSNFDSFLTLVRVDGITATEVDAEFLEDDDDAAGGLDARLSYTLDAGTIYAIIVSGLDYLETGSYTLTVN